MTYKLDVLGEICPHSLERVQKKMATMMAGEQLAVETDFGRALRNIMDWAEKAGHTFEVDEVADGVWQVVITKGGAS